jgi:phosphoglycolate phosphatase-like HAD superfamily hydrolase
MKIAIDMDNTIIDEFGSSLRPGILDFLEEISTRHELILWTNSKRIRAMEIIDHFDIRKYFTKIISRENYDPQEIGLRKDISQYGYDVLIDDDPEEIKYTESMRKTGILVDTYRQNKKVNETELEGIIKKYSI